MPGRLITVEEAAQILALPAHEVVQLTADGRLTRYRRGVQIVVDLDEVERLSG